MRGKTNLRQDLVTCNEKFDMKIRSGLENSGGVPDVWSPKVTELIKKHFPGDIKCEIRLYKDDELFTGGLKIQELSEKRRRI